MVWLFQWDYFISETGLPVILKQIEQMFVQLKER